MDLNDIYKVFNEEFMGHKVDSLIIASPLKLSPCEELIEEAWRKYATNELEREAKYLWDQIGKT